MSDDDDESPLKRKLSDDDFELSLDEKVAKLSEGTSGAPKPPPPMVPLPASEAARPPGSVGSRKVYVGSLPPTIVERDLKEYFTEFGDVDSCVVIRDQASGISRGFAFVTFVAEASADSAVMQPQHMLKGKEIRVMPEMTKDKDGEFKRHYKPFSQHHVYHRHGFGPGVVPPWMEDIVIPNQTRIYVGPLEEEVVGADLAAAFGQYGQIHAVSRLKGGAETSLKKTYGFIEFKESISVRRAFISKTSVKGKTVRAVCSRFAMELILSETSLFFCEAHLPCDDKHLEQHFRQFGSVFRCSHIPEDGSIGATELRCKTYGFVDFVSADSIERAMKQKSQLLPPGQFIKVVRQLPQRLLYDMMSISEKHGVNILRSIERVVPREGAWGGSTNAFKQGMAKGLMTSSQVRIPAAMIPKLIGERGKTITEISRDSKCKITIPKNGAGEKNVVLTIHGLKSDIVTAQYIMQQVLKGKKKY